MQELDQTQELIQMLKERLNEKDETIATLQATIETLQITIANLTETLDEFKRKFFGISSEKSKKNKLMNLFVKKPLSRSPVSL